MTEAVISLSTKMKKRLDFDHPVFDTIPEGKAGKMGGTTATKTLARWVDTRDQQDRDDLVMGYMWVAKDIVCRFRAHWPQTLPMTEDMASESLEALIEFVSETMMEYIQKGKLKTPVREREFFGKLQQFIHGRVRAYINDNRSTFGASARTNNRREENDEPLEYNFAVEHSDELNGELVTDPLLVDILDEVEYLSDVDQEEMRELVLQFLEQNHNIKESELTSDERESLEKLTQLVRNLK